MHSHKTELSAFSRFQDITVQIYNFPLITVLPFLVF